MSSPAESKKRLIAVLLFAWPLAVLIGWATARLSGTDWPTAALPVAWLGVLFWTLRRECRASA